MDLPAGSLKGPKRSLNFRPPGAPCDEIIDALRLLDRLAAEGGRPQPRNRRVLERRPARPPDRRDRNDDQGPRLH